MLVVPKFGRSIMSIILMQKAGCRYVVDGNGARLEKDNKAIELEALEQDHMFYLVGDIVHPEVNANPIILDNEDSNETESNNKNDSSDNE